MLLPHHSARLKALRPDRQSLSLLPCSTTPSARCRLSTKLSWLSIAAVHHHQSAVSLPSACLFASHPYHIRPKHHQHHHHSTDATHSGAYPLDPHSRLASVSISISVSLSIHQLVFTPSCSSHLESASSITTLHCIASHPQAQHTQRHSTGYHHVYLPCQWTPAYLVCIALPRQRRKHLVPDFRLVARVMFA